MKNRDLLLEIRSQHRFLSILRTLYKSPQYSTNSSVINAILTEYGLSGSAEVLRSDLSRLKDIGALEFGSSEKVVVAILTQKGLELATGVLQSDLIARPEPDCPY